MLEKAASRETWKDHIVHFLTGAIGEYYKAKLGEKNTLSVPQDIEHWYKEVRQLRDGARNAFKQKTKKNFNKEKAYKEACEELKEIDASMRRQAKYDIEKDYNTPVLVLISDKDTSDFWNMIDDFMLKSTL